MTVSNGPGRPLALTEEVEARVLAAIPEVLVQRQIAFLSRVHPATLNQWLTRGENDQKAGIDSVCAQFSYKYHHIRALKLRNYIEMLEMRLEDWRAISWLLEKCFREDFGAESQEIRELRELFMQILPRMQKGDLADGKENNQNQALESGPVAQ